MRQRKALCGRGFSQRAPSRSQVAPAQLTADVAPEPRGQPLGHGPPAPAVALGMRASHGRSQLRLVGGRQVVAALHTWYGAGRARRRGRRCCSAGRSGRSSRRNSRSRPPRRSPSCLQPAARGSANGCARPGRGRRDSAHGVRRRSGGVRGGCGVACPRSTTVRRDAV